MKSDNYIVIQGWMCNDLKLRGNDLLIFALIYGFSQDGESRFSGSRKYISETFNISLPTVDKSLKNLIKQNLIDQHKIEKNGVISYEYNTLPGVKKLYRGEVKKLYTGGKETLLGGGKETLPNNIDIHKTNKKDNNVLSKDSTDGFLRHHSLLPKQTQNLYSKCVSQINDFTQNKEVRSALLEYLDFRLEKGRHINKPLYSSMWKGMLNKLKREFDEKDWVSVIQQSNIHGWLSFYKNDRPDNNIPAGKRFDPHSKTVHMTEEDKKRQKEFLAERKAKGLQVAF